MALLRGARGDMGKHEEKVASLFLFAQSHDSLHNPMKSNFSLFSTAHVNGD